MITHTRFRVDVHDWNAESRALAESLGLERLDPGPAGIPGWMYYGVTAGRWRVLSQQLARKLGVTEASPPEDG